MITTSVDTLCPFHGHSSVFFTRCSITSKNISCNLRGISAIRVVGCMGFLGKYAYLLRAYSPIVKWVNEKIIETQDNSKF